MAKMLNLDKIQPEAKKVLKLHGEKHELKPMSVDEFIKLTQAAESESSGVEMPLSEQVEQFVGMAKMAFPTLSDEALGELSLEQLTAIVEFARSGDGEEEEEEKK